MSYNDNFNPDIQQHFRADLPRECAIGIGADLLRAQHQATSANNPPNVLQIWKWRKYGGIHAHGQRFKGRYKIIGQKRRRLTRAVHFPIAANKESLGIVLRHAKQDSHRFLESLDAARRRHS